MGYGEEINLLVGKTLEKVFEQGSDELHFVVNDSEAYMLYHSQDCCESVYLEDVSGNLEDLIGSPILQAEEVSGEAHDPGAESYTWTFYKIATIKGSVTLRWLGISNGYYSESVNFTRTV